MVRGFGSDQCRRHGRMIGASANEAQAMRGACLSIEEKLPVF
jgi:hypothetical protein